MLLDPTPPPGEATLVRALWLGGDPPDWCTGMGGVVLAARANLAEAIDQAPDLVIAEIEEVAEGQALLRNVRARRSAPIIVLMREASPEAEAALLKTGVDLVLEASTPAVVASARVQRIIDRLGSMKIMAPTGDEADLKAQARRLTALGYASRLLTQVSSDEAIFQKLVKLVARELHSHRVSVMSVDREANELVMTSAVGIPEDIQRQVRTPMGEGIAGTCAALGRPLFVDDHQRIREDADLSRYAADSLDKIVDETRPVSLTVPIMVKGEVVGVVNVTDRADGRPYSSTDITFIQALLGQTGYLMENARLMSGLKALTAFSERVIDTISDPLCVLDDQLRLVRFNARFQETFGEVEPGVDLLSHVQPADVQPETLFDLLRDHPEDGARRLGEWAINDGIYEVTLTPFRDGDRALSLVFLHDVTARRQMERRLVGAEKMASLGVLAAGVAHEINNPISFVKANTKRAREYMEDLIDLVRSWRTAAARVEHVVGDRNEFKDPRRLEDDLDLEFLMDDAADLVKESLEGVQRVEKIVMGLKSFAHPDNGKAHLTDLRDLVDNAIMLTKGRWKYALEIERDYAKVPEVWCLPTQLEQVFMNLIVNAAQAMEGWGHLKLSVQPDAEGVVLQFADDGKGIPDEVRARIFEPFFTTKDIGEGTGLGLAISWNILENHGGSIEVDSSGAGTTFTLRIPVGTNDAPIVVQQMSRFRI